MHGKGELIGGIWHLGRYVGTLVTTKFVTYKVEQEWGTDPRYTGIIYKCLGCNLFGGLGIV